MGGLLSKTHSSVDKPSGSPPVEGELQNGEEGRSVWIHRISLGDDESLLTKLDTTGSPERRLVDDPSEEYLFSPPLRRRDTDTHSPMVRLTSK